MRLVIFMALLLLSLPVSARAEAVNLRQALREAVVQRPYAEAARDEAAAARAAAKAAGSRYLPRATLSESFLWTDEPAGSLFISLNQEDLKLSNTADAYNFPPARKDFETRLSVEQPLYDPDLSYGRRRAEKGAEAARAAAGWSEQQAAFAAFRAYLEVQKARGALDWAESSRREAEETVRLATERQEAGVGLKADQLRARVELAEAERRRTTAAVELAIARRALALAMGREGEEIDIAAPLTPERLELTPPEKLERQDLEEAALRAEEAELAWRQSRAAYLPRAGLSASYALHDDSIPFGAEAGSWTVRAGLTWDFFDGGERGHARTGAAARKRAADALTREAVRQAGFEMEQARLRVEEARANLATARRAMAEAEETRRLLSQRFEAGLSDLSELLSAQTALDRTRLDAVAAESRLVLALGNVRFQEGTFLQALLPAEERTP